MVGRYTSLPVEVASTVPRRSLFRDSWVRHSSQPSFQGVSSAMETLEPTALGPPSDQGAQEIPEPSGLTQRPDTSLLNNQNPLGSSELRVSTLRPDTGIRSPSDQGSMGFLGPLGSTSGPTTGLRPANDQRPRDTTRPASVILTTYCPSGGVMQEFQGLTGRVSRARAFFESTTSQPEEPESPLQSPQEDISATAVTYRYKNPHRASPRPRGHRYRNTISTFPRWAPSGQHPAIDDAGHAQLTSPDLDDQGNIRKPQRTKDDTDIVEIKPVMIRRRFGTITGIITSLSTHDKEPYPSKKNEESSSSEGTSGEGDIAVSSSAGFVDEVVVSSISTDSGGEGAGVVTAGSSGGEGAGVVSTGSSGGEGAGVVSTGNSGGEGAGVVNTGNSGGEGAGVGESVGAGVSKGWDAVWCAPFYSPPPSCLCEHATLVSKGVVASESQDSAAGGHDQGPRTMVVPEDGQVQAAPRVVAACIKSYHDIPEELFNSLEESSVDPITPGLASTTPTHSPAHTALSPPTNTLTPAPSPPSITNTLPPTPAPRSDWRAMREGRRALLMGEVSDADTEGSEGDLGGVASTSDYHTSDGRGSSLSGASDDHHRNNDHRHDDHKNHNHDGLERECKCCSDAARPTVLIRNNFRGFCSEMLGSTRPHLPPARPPPPRECSSRSPSPENPRRPTQLEEELRAAGVYFRRPGSPPRVPIRTYAATRSHTPPRNPASARNHTQTRAYTPVRTAHASSRSEAEAVAAALDVLDSSLVGLSSSSSESSPARSHASSVVERRLSGPDPTPAHTPTSLHTHEHAHDAAGAPQDSTIIGRGHDHFTNSNHYRVSQCLAHGAGVGGRSQENGRPLDKEGGRSQEGCQDLQPKDAVMESLNLIEEVYVDARTVPHSSVSMHAYYPGVQYSPTTPSPTTPMKLGRHSSLSPTRRAIGPPTVPGDSDSGHESGATSPCGTGEDTQSPPPSPHTSHSATNTPSSFIHSRTSSLISCRGSGVLEGEVGVAVVGEPATHMGSGVGGVLEPRPPTHFVVVAIDFGTTYSGYAFSFTRDPDSVHMMKKWEGGDPGVQNQKTPTIVLLTPEGVFHSLGFTARDTYHDLDPSDAKRWLYFDKFKMVLHDDQSLNRDTLLEAANGKKVPALQIFSHALRYFRDHALRELTDQAGVPVLEEDVRWVITVPAIWSHPAKQFMRTAAYQAGMGSSSRPEQLLIALEPEAAAIYCRRLRRHQLLPERPQELRTPRYSLGRDSVCSDTETSPIPAIPELDRDTVYGVVDCGGGTVDITVHQMTDRTTGHLKELHKATGGPHGSIGVDAEFERFLETIFGTDFLATFRQQRPAAYVDLMIAFESRKRNASPYRSTPLNIALPFSFIDLYRKYKGKDVEWAIKKQQHLGVRWSSQGMLRVEQETMRQLFLPTLSSITQAIESVLSAPEVGQLQYMFLVGGFAESELLQKHIRDAFGHRVNVIIPQGMGLAILRGAVQFGLDPGVVTVRRSRLTYGVGVLNRYQKGVHPAEKRVVAAGAEWCADVLDRFVVVDESVAVGDVVVRSYTPATPAQSTVILHLYATQRHDAKFVTEDGVERVGTLHLDLGSAPRRHHHAPEGGGGRGSPRREITVNMKFGDTEVKASAVDHLTGQCVKANIDFLTL
ncbi:mucin-2-like isoform X2 [Cherax quadricarinatus]|uniref:mucin-2-like isoform X2 n=1 Tax=Cherax quadricarinatus TaxID=27406 RepID=UPI00387EAE97